jgi:hypothetical protein
MKHLKQVSGSRVPDSKLIAPKYEVEFVSTPMRSRDSAVGIATGFGLDD